MAFGGIKSVIIRNGVTGATIALTKIAPDSSFALKEPQTTETTDGGALLASFASRAEIITYDTEFADTLETLMREETPLSFYAEGIDGQIYWNEGVPITSIEKFTTRAGELTALMITFEARGATQEIYASHNYYWADGNGNYISDGAGNRISLRTD